MKLAARARSWLSWRWQRARRESEMEAELRFHLDAYAQELVRRGVAPDEAHRRARIEFGGIASHKDAMRAAVGLRLWDEVTCDVHGAVRSMRRNPGFTAVAVLSLALAIGANTAIFSLVYSLMLRRLPVRDPGPLVELLHRYPGEPRTNGFSWPAYQLMRDHNQVFSGLTASAYQALHVRGENLAPQTVQGAYVAGNFFSVLGVEPAVGRLLSREDDRLGAPLVGVVSWSYWKSRFNLDPEIVGKTITVDDLPVSIVGVAARKFAGLRIEAPQDIWLTLAAAPAGLRSSGQGSLWLVGRLKLGLSEEQARAEMAVLYQSTLEGQARASNNPFLRRMKLELAPAGAGLSRLREEWGRPLWLLLGVVVLLLLIACTSLAILLLARAAAREHEMAVRVSIGATRWRLLRQALTESLVLSAAGGLFGIPLAYLGVRMLVHIMASGRQIPGLPAHIEIPIHVDGRVLLFTVAVTLLTGLMFGIVPALRAMRTTPAPMLRPAGTTNASKVPRFFGKGLVVAQVALSVVLLSAAGLFVRELARLEHLDVGFQRDHVLLVTLDAEHSGYEGRSLARAYQELLVRLETIPGVRSGSLCAVSPIQGPGANRGIAVDGYQAAPGEIRNVMENWIAPRYFETLGTPLLAGRDFRKRDENGPRVAIINQTMARHYFGSGDSLGRHVSFDGDQQSYEIVGVAGDAKYMDMREATLPTIYLDSFQESWVPSQFVLRTSVASATLLPQVQQTVQELLKTVAVKRSITLSEQVDASIVPERLMATLSGWVGLLGTGLAAIGLYGLLAYTVARRTNEIGVRMALGATRSNVVRMVLSDAALMVCLGIAIGTPIAWWGKRLAVSLLQDMPEGSVLPVVFGAVSMIVVALLAALLPAQRAATVDPMKALRYE